MHGCLHGRAGATCSAPCLPRSPPASPRRRQRAALAHEWHQQPVIRKALPEISRGGALRRPIASAPPTAVRLATQALRAQRRGLPSAQRRGEIKADPALSFGRQPGGGRSHPKRSRDTKSAESLCSGGGRGSGRARCPQPGGGRGGGGGGGPGARGGRRREGGRSGAGDWLLLEAVCGAGGNPCHPPREEPPPSPSQRTARAGSGGWGGASGGRGAARNRARHAERRRRERQVRGGAGPRAALLPARNPLLRRFFLRAGSGMAAAAPKGATAAGRPLGR